MLFDALTLDASTAKRTTDGYLAVRAKAARIGTYDYLGREIDPDNKHGLRDAGIVKVLRDESTVFDAASARSFVGKPITDDHPNDPVTADNWRDHARGVVMGAMRDGEYLAFDLLLTDAEAIRNVDAGKRELSNGYGADLEFGDFAAADGTKCVARQTRISGNHVAIVDHGRAGSACRIGDAAPCVSLSDEVVNSWLADQRTYDRENGSGNNPSERREASKPSEGGNPLQDGAKLMPKIILVDGLQVEVTDAAEAAILKLQGQVKDAVAAKDTAETALATVQTAIAAKDTEIVTLKQAVVDAKVTPAQLRDAAKAYATVCDKAKALGVTIADNADTDTIMRAVVDAKMGELAKDWSAEQVAASFAVLSKDAKVEDKAPDPLRQSLADGGVKTIGATNRDSVNTSRAAWLADKQGAYRAQASN